MCMNDNCACREEVQDCEVKARLVVRVALGCHSLQILVLRRHG